MDVAELQKNRRLEIVVLDLSSGESGGEGTLPALLRRLRAGPGGSSVFIDDLDALELLPGADTAFLSELHELIGADKVPLCDAAPVLYRI